MYNSRTQEPPPGFKKKRSQVTHYQIRAVALGLRWDLVIPANSPSDHMGVGDPLCVTRQH